MLPSLRAREQEIGIRRMRAMPQRQHFAGCGFGAGIVTPGEGGAALLQRKLGRPVRRNSRRVRCRRMHTHATAQGRAHAGHGADGAGRRQRIRARICPHIATGGRAPLAELERQIANLLGQIVMIVVFGVFQFGNAAFQRAYLLFQGGNAHRQLRHGIAGAASVAGGRAALLLRRRNIALARHRLAAELLQLRHLLPQLQDFVLQRDAFAAVDLCLGLGRRGGQSGAKQCGRAGQGDRRIPHAAPKLPNNQSRFPNERIAQKRPGGRTSGPGFLRRAAKHKRQTVNLTAG